MQTAMIKKASMNTAMIVMDTIAKVSISKDIIVTAEIHGDLINRDMAKMVITGAAIMPTAMIGVGCIGQKIPMEMGVHLM